MDLDILKRKLKTRDYYVPLLNNYYVAYKLLHISGIDYTIESSDISKNNFIINISKFMLDDAKKYQEVFVAKVKCRNVDEFIDALDQLNSLKEPFTKILTKSNITFIKKKTWIAK
jgi:hypothetical protein